MYKISKIELDDFRVFKGHRTFDFLNQANKPYNFICIYGPNGSGKTSFVDALEWLSTGKLHRIESDMHVQENTFNGPILTNIESYGNQQWADVTAHFLSANQESQQRRALRPRVNSINDYLGGICKDNILSPMQILPYSKVAGFVSATKPEERFNTWTEFVNPDEQNYYLLENTYRLKLRIESLLDNMKNEIEKNNLSIANCNLNAELITTINGAILTYNENYKVIFPQEEAIVLIQQNESKNYRLPNLSKLKALQIRASSELERLRTRETLFKQLIAGYSEYQNAAKELTEISKSEIAYQERLEKIQKKIDIDTLKNSLVSQYTALISIISDSIDKTKDHHNQIVKQKGLFIEQQKVWQEQLQKIELDYNTLKESDPNLAYKDAVDRNEILKSNLQILSKINNEIKSGNFAAASGQAAIFMERYRQRLIDSLRGLTERNIAVQKAAELRKQALQQIRESESTCNEITSAIEQIRSQITNMHLTVCPVCQTPFSSTEELLSRIKQFCSKKLEEARKNYNEKDILLKNVSDSYQKLLQSWDLAEHEIRIALEEEFTSQDHMSKELAVKVKQFDQAFSLLNGRLKTLKEQLNCMMKFDDELTPITFASWVNKAYEYFVNSDLQSQTILQQLSTLSEALHSVHQSLSSPNGDELQRLETSIHLILNQTDESNALNTSVQNYLSNIDKLKALLIVLPDFLEIDSTELPNYKTKISDAAKRTTALEHIIDAYRKLLADTQFVQQATIEQINKQSSSDNEVRNTLEIKVLPSLINILSNETELLSYQKQYQNLIQQKVKLEDKIKSTEHALKKISTIYESMCLTQQEQVNKVFASKMVNDIYRLLEPNKDFPQLNFKINFNNAGRPELYIRAHERSNFDSVVLPELIFSTAQLNTISLCIFLSNALSNKQLDARTLILDDPISSFDDINTVAFSDLLRILCVQNNWQIIFTTHDERLFRLLQVKLSPRYHNSVFMQFQNKGQLVNVSTLKDQTLL